MTREDMKARQRIEDEIARWLAGEDFDTVSNEGQGIVRLASIDCWGGGAFTLHVDTRKLSDRLLDMVKSGKLLEGAPCPG